MRRGIRDHLPAQHRPQLVMPVREAMGFNANGFARDSLDWKSTAIDGRQYGIDDGAHPALRQTSGCIMSRRGRGRSFRGLAGCPCAPAPLFNHEVPSAE
jgi:hypothetical protein